MTGQPPGGHAYMRTPQNINVRMPKFTFENMADDEERKQEEQP